MRSWKSRFQGAMKRKREKIIRIMNFGERHFSYFLEPIDTAM